MLKAGATPCIAPLLVIHESMSERARAANTASHGKLRRLCAILYIQVGHYTKVITDSGDSGEEREKYLCCIFKVWANKRFVQGEGGGVILGYEQRRVTLVKIAFHCIFGTMGNVVYVVKFRVQEKSQIWANCFRCKSIFSSII